MIIQFLAVPIALRHLLDSSGKDIDGHLALSGILSRAGHVFLLVRLSWRSCI